MPTNILQAIVNIVENPITELKAYYETRNRANSMGGALEEYVKDIFANTTSFTDEVKRLEVLQKTFSYHGNQNNPPDAIIKDGDAIEVKKIESKNSALALNSSYPKAKLYANSSMITDACRNCENWTEKDIIYVVGVVPKESGKEGKHLRQLCFVYGVDYAASANIYKRIKGAITDGLNSTPNIELAPTNEIGRVNKVDPLGITYLRIRGMWGIENPMKAFSYLLSNSHKSREMGHTPPRAFIKASFPDTNCDFNFIAIINIDKYNSFDLDSRNKIDELAKENSNFNIEDIKIKVPDNPSQLKDAKLITFFV